MTQVYLRETGAWSRCKVLDVIETGHARVMLIGDRVELVVRLYLVRER